VWRDYFFLLEHEKYHSSMYIRLGTQHLYPYMKSTLYKVHRISMDFPMLDQLMLLFVVRHSKAVVSQPLNWPSVINTASSVRIVRLPCPGQMSM
jgi:hypothetical protein